MSFLEREVEQDGEQLDGQLYRDVRHPVEFLADRQAVELGLGAGPDAFLQLLEVGRRQRGADRSPLLGVNRRVADDEARLLYLVLEMATVEVPVVEHGGSVRRE